MLCHRGVVVVSALLLLSAACSRPEPTRSNSTAPDPDKTEVQPTTKKTGSSEANEREPTLPTSGGAQFEKGGPAIGRKGGQPIKLLYVEQDFRWEARALNDALKRDVSLRYQGLFLGVQSGWRQPVSRDNKPVPLTTAILKADGVLRDKASFAAEAYRVVIVGDVEFDNEAFNADCWDSLEDWVKAGGGLILLGGPANMPALHSKTPAFQRLMPGSFGDSADLPKVDTTQEKLWGLTAEGWEHAIFKVSKGAERNRQVWGREVDGKFQAGQLNGMYWFLNGMTPKPEATVLVRAVRRGQAVAESDPVIVAMPVGKGRVLWIGTEDLYRLREFIGDHYYYKVWQNSIAWAANESAPD